LGYFEYIWEKTILFLKRKWPIHVDSLDGLRECAEMGGWGLMANCCNDDPTPSRFPFFFVGIGQKGSKKEKK